VSIPPETETCHAVDHCRQLDVTMPAATEGLAREGQVGHMTILFHSWCMKTAVRCVRAVKEQTGPAAALGKHMKPPCCQHHRCR
jgi:hypothetical protein